MNALKEYFNGLEAREKNLIIIAGLIFVLVLPYQLIWKPFTESIDNTAIRVQAQKQQFVKMQQQAKMISQMQGADGIVSQPGKQFMNNAINTAAKRYGLSSSLNVKSGSNNSLRVSLDNVPFDNVMNWLDQLSMRNGVTISKLNIDRQPTVGRVNVSVYLESP